MNTTVEFTEKDDIGTLTVTITGPKQQVRNRLEFAAEAYHGEGFGPVRAIELGDIFGNTQVPFVDLTNQQRCEILAGRVDAIFLSHAKSAHRKKRRDDAVTLATSEFVELFG